MSILPQYTVFKGVSQLTENNLINSLEENFKSYLDWGFLNIGGYINVNIPTSGLYGGTFHQLKTTEVQGYKVGQVWQSHKKDWIWESGFYYNDGFNDNNTVNSISGVFVNNTFFPGPTGTGNNGYYINYPLGQIIFDKPLPKTAKVELNYSYRWCQVYKFSSDPYVKELQELTYQPAPQINQTDKGDYNLGANHRVQMPCIIIEPIARSYSLPWQLGSESLNIGQDLLLHIFTENAVDKNRITDIIRLQKERTLEMYDLNKVVKSGVYPIDYKGSKNPSGLMYYDLINHYYWNKTYIKNVNILDMESRHKNLYWCTIRLTSETIV
jgi:hypothetical protein